MSKQRLPILQKQDSQSSSKKKSLPVFTSSEGGLPSQQSEEASQSVGKLPTVGGDTVEEQGNITVEDFGVAEEPTESAKSLADDLGVSVDELLTTETLKDPKLQERNLGRPLPESNQYLVDGKPVYRDEMIDVINNQVDKIQEGLIDLEINDDEELQQRLQRQIDAGGRGGDILESLGAGLVSTAQSAEGLKDLAATTIEEITGLPASKTTWAIKSKLDAKELGEKAEEIRQRTRAYEGNFLESLANGNFADAGFQGLNLTMESLPITAMSAVTGGGGSIGSYLLRSATVLTPMMASREFSEAQMSEDPDVQQLSQTQKVLRSWLYGGAEALGESVTGRIASKNFKLLKGGMKRSVAQASEVAGEEAAKKTARQMAIQTSRDIAKNMGVDMNAEGASEAITEMSQMLTDDLMGVKDFTFGDYAERMSNAYASGAFMGAVMGGVVGGVGITANAVKKYRQTSLENIEKGLNTSVEQGEITEDRANEVREEAEAISQTNPTLSDEAQAKQAGLIKERTQLEQFLEGVDKAAAPNQYERINKINEELTQIAENDEVKKEEELRTQQEEKRIRQEEQARDEAKEEIADIPDDETVTITVETKEEIPDQFKDRAEDGRFIIYALTDPNVSTPLHELAHVYEHYLTDTERKQIEKWSGHKAGTVEFSEAFARGFEKFLSEGKVSNPRLQTIFENFKKWLTEIYNGIVGSDIDVKLNDKMRSLYDSMLSEETSEGIYEDIFIRSGDKIKDSFREFRKRWFSARKFLPKSAFKIKQQREADIARQLNKVEETAADFNRIINKLPKEQKEKTLNDVDKFVRGQEVELSEELLPIANDMRNQIDALSEQLINEGVVPEYYEYKVASVDGDKVRVKKGDGTRELSPFEVAEAKEKYGELSEGQDIRIESAVKRNLGEYITRSYKVYDRSNWKKEVEETTIQAAKNFLRQQIKDQVFENAKEFGLNPDELLDRTVDAKIDELLTKEGANNFLSSSKLGSKDLNVLKQRQDIPFEIRALMGEYSDPVQNYARTMYKMANLVANARFLNNVKKAGLGTYFFEKNDPRRVIDGIEFNTQIAPEGSETMNPLNGLYTTKEIAEELNEESDQLGEVLRNYMKVVSAVKWAKTIGSYATQMKNIFGNLGFMAANGHWRVSKLKDAVTTVSNDISKLNNKELREKMDRYISLGIVKQSAGLGEIRAMFKDANWDEKFYKTLTNRQLTPWNKTVNKLLKGKKIAEDIYQGVDDMFKIVAYENEVARYKEAMFGDRDLTEQEQKELDDTVTEIVKNTYPTYDRVPEAIQMIRRFPFVGNFVSFQAEAWRTAYNTVDIAREELQSDNPKIRKIGAQRLAGILTYEGLKDGLLTYFGIAAGTGLAGIFSLGSDDDEKQKDRDVRMFVAPWSKASDLIVLNANNGELSYIDFSASDPHGGLREAVNGFLLGKDGLNSFTDGVYRVVEPFVGEEIATRAIRAMLDNRDAYGKPIYNPEDTKLEQSKDLLAYAYKVMELGSIKSLRRMYETENKGEEFLASVLGFRRYTLKVSDKFGYDVKEYRDRISNAKKIYNSVYYDKKATTEEKDEAYKRANERYQDVLFELHEIYSAAVRLGAKPSELTQKMKDFNLSETQRKQVRSGAKYVFPKKH